MAITSAGRSTTVPRVPPGPRSSRWVGFASAGSPDMYATGTSSHRIGLIVPSSNTTMETELPAMFRAREAALPGDTFTFHASRMRMQRVSPEELLAMNAQLARSSAEIADAGCDVVATACLVALMAQGPVYHCQAEQEIRSVLSAAS